MSGEPANSVRTLSIPRAVRLRSLETDWNVEKILLHVALRRVDSKGLTLRLLTLASEFPVRLLAEGNSLRLGF